MLFVLAYDDNNNDLSLGLVGASEYFFLLFIPFACGSGWLGEVKKYFMAHNSFCALNCGVKDAEKKCGEELGL